MASPTPSPTASTSIPTPLAAIGGLAAAGFGLGLAELVAGIRSQWRSPVLDVGDRVIDSVPGFLKDIAIELFGTKDKVALLVGIGAVLALFAATLGVLGLRKRMRYADVGIIAFAVVGSAAAVFDRAGVDIGAAIPTLVGAGGAAAAFRVLDFGAVSVPSSDHEPATTNRRALLIGIGTAAAGATVFASAGRWLGRRFSAAESRAAVRLPTPVEPLDVVPASAQAPNAAPFFTSNADFYRIDTALTVPQVPTEGWRLRVHGMVERELELSYDDLLDRGLIERDITLTCVSNTIGGELMGTARWLGARLDDLLNEAGIAPGADQIVGRSVDGYTCGFPVSTLDGRDALVAVAMNGEPLPLEHGFPARLIVPGLYGYVSATKWLTELELTTFDAFDHYWVPRGYAAQAPIKLQSRIDTPRGLDRIPAGPFVIGGVAWEQTVGIEAVEVRIDEGPWQQATLADEVNDVTWRQWSLAWEATSGRHSIEVRAISKDGAIQTDERSEPLPDGASGHHTVVVLVDEA